MQNLQEYKCPCCGGAIAFDSTAQKLKCPYCDTEFEIETLKGYEEELKATRPTTWNGRPMREVNGSRARRTAFAITAAIPAAAK